MKILSIICCLILLCSCAENQQPNQEQILAQQQAQEKVHEERIKNCPLEKKGQAAKRQRCIRDITISEHQNDSNLPIFLKYKEKGIKLAEQYDKGAISKTRYDELDSDLKASFMSEQSSNNQQLQQQYTLVQQQNLLLENQREAASQQRRAQAWSIFNQGIQQNTPTSNSYQPPVQTITTTNCQKFGNTVNCNTY